MSDVSAEVLAAAINGDADAVETLLGSIQDRMYRLCLRMVSAPADAEDATQEILLKILTRLSSYRGEAAFETWAHRVATNHLLDRKKAPIEQLEFSFDWYAQDLLEGLAAPEGRSAPERNLLEREVKLGCTQAMLACLDREHRVAYVLGEIFRVSSEDGAYICEVPASTYRKRLSRSRAKLRTFLESNCGLINETNATCRCSHRIERAVELGRIVPSQCKFSNHPARTELPQADLVTQGVEDMTELHDVASLFRDHPSYVLPEGRAERISQIVRSDRFSILRASPGTQARESR